MIGTEANVRGFHLGDLPLLQRLKSYGISMDSESYLARGLHTVEDAALSRIPLVGLGTPTFVTTCGHEQAFGQLRHKKGDTHAHIVFVAPALTNGFSVSLEGAWMHLLDGLAHEAGRRGAHVIYAEVDENSLVYEALRRAGFAVYAQQDIWRRDPAPPLYIPHPGIQLERATAADMPAVRYLHAQTVPQLARQADPSPAASGMLYYREGKAWAYIAASEGNRGIYCKPYLHEDVQAQASIILAAAMNMCVRAARLPVYCCIRQYQSWLGGTLESLGFKPWARQAVMVKHTTVRVQHPEFSPLPSVKGGIQIPGGPTGNG